jgi:hypothetical protein
MEENPEETKELLFAAIVATSTGRMGAFYQWSTFKKLDQTLDEKRRQKTVFFPKPSETEEFLDYMQKVSTNGKTGNFLSDQFKKSLPKCFLKVNGYSAFLRQVRRELHIFYEDLIKELKKRKKKHNVVKLMKNFLKTTTTGAEDLSFLASQIMYNVDEMIDLVPGCDWEEVEFGFGSKQAMHWLMGSAKDDERKEYLQTVIKTIKAIPDDDVLACLGLERVTEHGKCHVRWKVNQRNIGIHDIEHFACKLWLVMVRIIGARPSKNPRLHRPHLHPLKIDKNLENTIYHSLVFDIAKEATNQFKNNKMCIPDCFKEWSSC